MGSLRSVRSVRSMKVPATALVAVLLTAGVPVLASAAPAGAGVTLNLCISINGVTQFQSGSATCDSVGPDGTRPSIAVASGANSSATEFAGSGFQVYAIGTNATGLAEHGLDLTATALGDGSSAFAGAGDNDTSTAVGTGAHAIANGSHDVATAIGKNSTASALAENGCTEFASGGASLTCQ